MLLFFLEMPHICIICCKSFTSADNLRRHIKSFHEKKSYTCQVCSKSFTRKYGLNVHMKLHNKPSTRPVRKIYEYLIYILKLFHNS